MTGGPPKPEPQVVPVPRKPTTAQVVSAMTTTGLPLDTVWNVYGAMIEAADQEDPEAHAGTPVVPPGPDIHKVTRMPPEQCRHARALINWSKLDLARASGIMARTIGLWERGKHPSVEPMVALMRTALEEAGIAFSPDGGRVWLRQGLEWGPAP